MSACRICYVIDEERRAEEFIREPLIDTDDSVYSASERQREWKHYASSDLFSLRSLFIIVYTIVLSFLYLPYIFFSVWNLLHCFFFLSVYAFWLMSVILCYVFFFFKKYIKTKKWIHEKHIFILVTIYKNCKSWF